VFGKMADKYGPIFTVKVGVHRALVVSSWEMAKECLTTNDKIFANRPKTLAMEVLGYDFAVFGFSPYGQYWRNIRKIATVELFSLHRLQMMSEVRESVVQSSIKQLFQLCSLNKVRVDMKRWFHDVALNVILSIAVGKRCDFDQDSPWKEALIKYFVLSGLFVVSDALPFLRWFDIGGHEKEMRKTSKELDEVAQQWLNDHKLKKVNTRDDQEQDFMDVLLSVIDEGEDKFEGRDADTIIKATCLTVILGGSDTTTVTLVWALSLLVNNPHTLKKVQQELDSHIGREKQSVKESDVSKLIYLQAVVKETLRLYPPAPLAVPHESMEDCNVGNYHVLANTQLHINVSKINRDPRVWTDPDEFRPERFLSSDLDVRGKNFELLPFSSGRRMCPAVSFALQVLQLTLANLLHGFEIATDESIDMTEKVGLTNLKTTPLDLLIAPRLPAHLYQ
jgi:cytochrome P450